MATLTLFLFAVAGARSAEPSASAPSAAAPVIIEDQGGPGAVWSGPLDRVGASARVAATELVYPAATADWKELGGDAAVPGRPHVFVYTSGGVAVGTPCAAASNIRLPRRPIFTESAPPVELAKRRIVDAWLFAAKDLAGCPAGALTHPTMGPTARPGKDDVLNATDPTSAWYSAAWYGYSDSSGLASLSEFFAATDTGKRLDRERGTLADLTQTAATQARYFERTVASVAAMGDTPARLFPVAEKPVADDPNPNHRALWLGLDAAAGDAVATLVVSEPAVGAQSVVSVAIWVDGYRLGGKSAKLWPGHHIVQLCLDAAATVCDGTSAGAGTLTSIPIDVPSAAQGKGSARVELRILPAAISAPLADAFTAEGTTSLIPVLLAHAAAPLPGGGTVSLADRRVVVATPDGVWEGLANKDGWKSLDRWCDTYVRRRRAGVVIGAAGAGVAATGLALMGASAAAYGASARDDEQVWNQGAYRLHVWSFPITIAGGAGVAAGVVPFLAAGPRAESLVPASATAPGCPSKGAE